MPSSTSNFVEMFLEIFSRLSVSRSPYVERNVCLPRLLFYLQKLLLLGDVEMIERYTCALKPLRIVKEIVKDFSKTPFVGPGEAYLLYLQKGAFAQGKIQVLKFSGKALGVNSNPPVISSVCSSLSQSTYWGRTLQYFMSIFGKHACRSFSVSFIAKRAHQIHKATVFRCHRKFSMPHSDTPIARFGKFR